MKNYDEKIFNELIKTRKKIDLIYDDRDSFNAESSSGQYIFPNVFSMLASTYSHYSVKNNQIKDIDFVLTELLLSNVNFEDNYAVSFKDDTVAYEENKITIKSQAGNCIVVYKKNAEGKFMCLSKSISNFGLNSEQMLEYVKELGCALDKARKFQKIFISILKGGDVTNFVKEYKDNRELLTIVFINVENETKERLFNEIKKQDKALSMADLNKLIDVLKNASEADKKYEHTGENKMLPRGWYNALLIESALDSQKNIDFNLIRSLFNYESLNEKLSYKDIKDESKRSKIKI